jgi:tRNA dimethylallyltransferase
MKRKLIALLGPTASGKTHLAVMLAAKLGAHILSADSRQVYRSMDIGTGKDLQEYCYQGQNIPYHLIDIFAAGEQCNLFNYLNLFYQIYDQLEAQQTPMILCGGSGMYAEAILRNYNLVPVAPQADLRTDLEMLSDDELKALLTQHQTLHNTTDTSSRKRLIRAVEIALASQADTHTVHPTIENFIFALDVPQALRWQRIEQRLKDRLENGLVEEVRTLLVEGLTTEQLIYYGLEYKYVTQFVMGEITSREELFRRLNIAIRQFAKRQMTYLRGMERRGLTLHWLDGTLHPDALLNTMLEQICRL